MVCCILRIVEALCPSAAADHDRSRSPSPSVARALGTRNTLLHVSQMHQMHAFLFRNTRCTLFKIQCEKLQVGICKIERKSHCSGSMYVQRFKSREERFIPIVSSYSTLDRMHCIYFGDNEDRICDCVRDVEFFFALRCAKWAGSQKSF